MSVPRLHRCRTRPAGRALLLPFAAGICLAVGAGHAAAVPAPAINPERTAIVARATIPDGAEVRLEVRSAAGRVIALTPPRIVRPGPRGVAWDGRLGPAGTGPRARDGVYRLRLLVEGARVLPVVPARVRIDTTPPRVSGRAVGPVTLPATRPGLRVGVRDAGSVAAIRVRAVRAGGGAGYGSRWTRPSTAPPLPAALASGRAWGPFDVTVLARDAAGNVGESRPVPIVVPPAAGPTRVVSSGSRSRRQVAIVFDDGLFPGAMRRILATIESRGAGATFCLNGTNAGRIDAALRRSLRAAQTEGRLDLCSHGYSHRTGSDTSYDAALGDLRGNLRLDQALGVASAPFYRPPFGRSSPGLRAAASTLGYRYILMWDVDPSDYLPTAPSVIANRVVRGARGGSIIILHLVERTASALPAIIDGLRARGLEPVTAGRLLRGR